MTKRNFAEGQYLFAVNQRMLYIIDKVDDEKQKLSYRYLTEDKNLKFSFWIEFGDEALESMLDSGRVIHIKTEHERLAIQLKHSGAM